MKRTQHKYIRKPITAWHFVDKTLRGGAPVPADGVWLTETRKPHVCHHGLHASRNIGDALRYSPGPILCRVQLRGWTEEHYDRDKLASQQRKIIERMDVTKIVQDLGVEIALELKSKWRMPRIVRKALETRDVTDLSTARAALHNAGYSAVRGCAHARDATVNALNMFFSGSYQPTSCLNNLFFNAATSVADKEGSRNWRLERNKIKRRFAAKFLRRVNKAFKEQA